MTLSTLCRSIWGDSAVAGHPAIAVPGASYAIDFSHSMKNAELLPPVAAGCTAVKIDEASRRRESGTKTVTCPRKRGSSTMLAPAKKAIRRAAEVNNVSGRVFWQYQDRMAPRSPWNRARKNFPESLRDMRLHDCRHLCASLLAANGATDVDGGLISTPRATSPVLRGAESGSPGIRHAGLTAGCASDRSRPSFHASAHVPRSRRAGVLEAH
jgi:hypothetical protein